MASHAPVNNKDGQRYIGDYVDKRHNAPWIRVIGSQDAHARGGRTSHTWCDSPAPSRELPFPSGVTSRYDSTTQTSGKDLGADLKLIFLNSRPVLESHGVSSSQPHR